MNEQEENYQELELLQQVAMETLISFNMDWVLAYHSIVRGSNYTGVQKYIIGNYIKEYRNECEESVKVFL